MAAPPTGRTEPSGPGVSPLTRTRVVQVLAEHGQATVPAIATELGLTQAAVRRHLDALQAQGVVEPAPHPRRRQRGRGRPATTFQLTSAGRSRLPAAYDALAVEALRFLAHVGGDAAVTAFAQAHVADLDTGLPAGLTDAPAVQRADALAQVLTQAGYVASSEPAPGGAQLCQHHCPVAHVAEQYPQLCEAETQAFARVLGTHVQRLATIAHGDGICTTFVPEHDPSPHERTSA